MLINLNKIEIQIHQADEGEAEKPSKHWHYGLITPDSRTKAEI